MTEKSAGVNRKICVKSEEYSGKLKKAHLFSSRFTCSCQPAAANSQQIRIFYPHNFEALQIITISPDPMMKMRLRCNLPCPTISRTFYYNVLLNKNNATLRLHRGNQHGSDIRVHKVIIKIVDDWPGINAANFTSARGGLTAGFRR
ncbi:hypothetical protein ACMYSL_28450 [Klebsiella sp. MISC125]|uniref:hypothetical protein n=1 Tax=Klebsiella sp. MISC125 TaxID=2755386 RepID=UPI003DA7D675